MHFNPQFPLLLPPHGSHLHKCARSIWPVYNLTVPGEHFYPPFTEGAPEYSEGKWRPSWLQGHLSDFSFSMYCDILWKLCKKNGGPEIPWAVAVCEDFSEENGGVIPSNVVMLAPKRGTCKSSNRIVLVRSAELRFAKNKCNLGC